LGILPDFLALIKIPRSLPITAKASPFRALYSLFNEE